MKEKQFKCDICNVRFGQKSNLNNHVETVYEGKKRFKCDICNAEFGQKSNLNVHVATVHEGKKQFKCGFCNTNLSMSMKERNAEFGQSN